MMGVTPVGILTNDPAGSRDFYSRVLGIERVLTLREVVSDDFEGVLMRIESPQVEVLSTEVRLLDRAVNQTVRHDHRIIFRPNDFGGLVARLSAAGIPLRYSGTGVLNFKDINGISWDVKTPRLSILPDTFN